MALSVTTAQSLLAVLTQMRILRVQFAVTAVDTIYLPGYKGSGLRGAFGRELRKVSCTLPEEQCPTCLLHASCPYGYCFETMGPPREEHGMWSIKAVPRPFVLVPPPINSADMWRPGEKIVFHLILIGRAIPYLPYFVSAFVRVGKGGIGAGRGRFALSEVIAEANGSHSIYDHGNSLPPWQCYAQPIVDASFAYAPTNSVKINFHTMTRLKSGAHLQDAPEFRFFIQAALSRLAALAYVHHGFRPNVDWHDVLDLAEQVMLVENQTQWVDWERYSSRQKSPMTMGGIIGTAIYTGNLTPLLPLLEFAQKVHVGKNTTFGLGEVTWNPVHQ